MDTVDRLRFETGRFGMEYKKEELLRNAKGIVRINHARFRYQFFNVCFLHEMLSYMLETLRQGYIPYIDITAFSEESDGGYNIWGSLFRQPFEDRINVESMEMKDSGVLGDKGYGIPVHYHPGYESVFDSIETELMSKLYHDWVIIRDDVFQYIAEEYRNLLYGKKVLGVLYRGTDMARLKLAGHPMQPSLEQIIEDGRRWMEEYHFDAIYLATEEEKADRRFEEAFPGRVMRNGREYFDKSYDKLSEEKRVAIGAVYPAEQEARKKLSRSYLSSLVLLASCNSLLAGNCGGSNAALYLNDNQYERYQIYDLGYY